MRHPTALLLLAAPLAVLGGAFAWLAWDHGAGLLGGAAVHEDGRRDLLDTVLYARHFLRELAPASLCAVACAGAFFTYGPRAAPSPSRRCAGAAALGLILAAALAASLEAGVEVAAGDLLQAYTRDDEGSAGAHWRSHLLATFGFGAGAVAAAAALARAVDGAWRMPHPVQRRRWIGGCAAAFALITLACHPDATPFLQPRSIGHQARELATHLAITLPLGLAVLLSCTRPRQPLDGEHGSSPPRDAVAAALLAGLAAVWLVAGAWLLDAVAAARPGARPSALLAAHAIEHVPDSLLVALLCAWMAGWRAGEAPA